MIEHLLFGDWIYWLKRLWGPAHWNMSPSLTSGTHLQTQILLSCPTPPQDKKTAWHLSPGGAAAAQGGRGFGSGVEECSVIFLFFLVRTSKNRKAEASAPRVRKTILKLCEFTIQRALATWHGSHHLILCCEADTSIVNTVGRRKSVGGCESWLYHKAFWVLIFSSIRWEGNHNYLSGLLWGLNDLTQVQPSDHSFNNKTLFEHCPWELPHVHLWMSAADVELGLACACQPAGPLYPAYQGWYKDFLRTILLKQGPELPVWEKKGFEGWIEVSQVSKPRKDVFCKEKHMAEETKVWNSVWSTRFAVLLACELARQARVGN